jgi:hypothetical protein
LFLYVLDTKRIEQNRAEYKTKPEKRKKKTEEKKKEKGTEGKFYPRFIPKTLVVIRN